jgi:hypothetical protein
MALQVLPAATEVYGLVVLFIRIHQVGREGEREGGREVEFDALRAGGEEKEACLVDTGSRKEGGREEGRKGGKKGGGREGGRGGLWG